MENSKVTWKALGIIVTILLVLIGSFSAIATNAYLKAGNNEVKSAGIEKDISNISLN